MINRKQLWVAVAAVSATLTCNISHADEIGVSTATSAQPALTGSITFASDYIWRGLTQTFGLPALQAGVDYRHESGIYGGFWASNVSEKWVPGSNLETDYYLGYKADLGAGVGLDLNLLYVYYPGADFKKTFDGNTLGPSKPNTFEPSLTLSYGWASFKYSRTINKFYGWNTNNSAPGVFSAQDMSAGVTGSTAGSQCFEFSANFEVAEKLVVSGQVGRQLISHSTRINWSYAKIGITKTILDNWSIGLAVSGTTNPNAFKKYVSLTGNGETEDVARPRAVLSISKAF